MKKGILQVKRNRGFREEEKIEDFQGEHEQGGTWQMARVRVGLLH